jgi:hypothetical protein
MLEEGTVQISNLSSHLKNLEEEKKKSKARRK